MKKVLLASMLFGLMLCANVVIAQTVQPGQLIYPIVEPIKEKLIGVIVKNEKPIPVEISNPAQCEMPKYTTKVLGSDVDFSKDDTFMTFKKGDPPKLYREYQGSGILSYLVVRSYPKEYDPAIQIRVDNQVISHVTLSGLKRFLPSGEYWHIFEDGPEIVVIECTKKIPFKESLQIFLESNGQGDVNSTAHIEIETTD